MRRYSGFGAENSRGYPGHIGNKDTGTHETDGASVRNVAIDFRLPGQSSKVSVIAAALCRPSPT